MLNSREELTIHPEDLVEDYGRSGKWSIRTLEKLAKTEVFPAERPAVSPRKGMTPEQYIREAGLQPFSENNAKFDAVTLFTNITFWRGSFIRQVAPDGSETKRFVIYSLEGQKLEKAIIALAEALNEKSPYLWNSGRGKRNEHLTIDAVWGRFLSIFSKLLGPKKATAACSIPKHVLIACNMLKKSSVPEEEVIWAKNVLRDFILAFFYVQKTYNHQGTYTGSIPGSQNIETATERRDRFVEAVAMSGLEMEISTKGNIAKNPGQKTLYTTCIRFPDLDEFTVGRYRTEYHGRIFEAIERIERTKNLR